MLHLCIGFRLGKSAQDRARMLLQCTEPGQGKLPRPREEEYERCICLSCNCDTTPQQRNRPCPSFRKSRHPHSILPQRKCCCPNDSHGWTEASRHALPQQENYLRRAAGQQRALTDCWPFQNCRLVSVQFATGCPPFRNRGGASHLFSQSC